MIQGAPRLEGRFFAFYGSFLLREETKKTPGLLAERLNFVVDGRGYSPSPPPLIGSALSPSPSPPPSTSSPASFSPEGRDSGSAPPQPTKATAYTTAVHVTISFFIILRNRFSGTAAVPDLLGPKNEIDKPKNGKIRLFLAVFAIPCRLSGRHRPTVMLW